MLFTNYINPLVTNGLFHPYHLNEPTFIFRGVRSVVLCSFFDENNSSNRIAPDETQRIAASHLGLFCLHMSHKNDARLIWVHFLSEMVLHIKRTTGA